MVCVTRTRCVVCVGGRLWFECIVLGWFTCPCAARCFYNVSSLAAFVVALQCGAAL